MSDTTGVPASHLQAVYNQKICNQVLRDFYTCPEQAVIDPRLLARIPLRGNEPPLPVNQPWMLLSLHRQLWHFTDARLLQCLDALKQYYTRHKRAPQMRSPGELLACQLLPALLQYYAAICMELDQAVINEYREAYRTLAQSQRSTMLVSAPELRCLLETALYEQRHVPEPLPYEQFEQWCRALYGQSWQKSAADFFGIGKASITSWKKKNELPAWVSYCRADLLAQLEARRLMINEALLQCQKALDPELSRFAPQLLSQNADDIFPAPGSPAENH